MVDLPPGGPAAARLLVVDDDPTALLVAEAALREQGFRVITAEHGRGALETFDRHRPDLVVLDVDLPDLDGFEICRRIRTHPRGLTVPVVMATGMDDMDSIERSYHVGATDFAAKPIQWTIVGRRLRHMLRSAALLEQLNRANEELRRSREDLAHAQSLARLGNWEWDPDADRITGSEQWHVLLGVERGAEIGLEEVLSRVHRDDRECVREWFADAATARCRSTRFRIHREDRSLVHLQQRGEFRRDSDGGRRVRGTAQDITKLTRAEEQIHRMAYYDSLTGLPNRLLFKEWVNQALDLAHRHGRMLAVLFLDLDDFKRINDTLGHSIGDLMLVEAARRLSSSVRGADVVTGPQLDAARSELARLGGDEFTILLSEIDSAEDAAVVARRVHEVLGRPMNLGGHDVVVTSSIGIALYPADGVDAETLLMNADTAMYHAKADGKNMFRFFAPPMGQQAMRRLSLESNLRRAVSQGELVLHYQPVARSADRRIVGVEALARWTDPELGPVSPGEFIPLAERTGMILVIGEWVLRSACRQVRQWQEQGHHDLTVCVNLSGRQFLQGSLARQVRWILRDTGLPPENLMLEITEGLLMEDADQAAEILSGLRELGVSVALDDFGNGYTSLRQLKRFPIDQIKIDQTFIGQVPEEASDAALVRAMAALARGLGIGVIAEGVETEAQAEFLHSVGCDALQGYLVSEPLPPEAMAELLSQRRRA